jgi:hypothetical protein
MELSIDLIKIYIKFIKSKEKRWVSGKVWIFITATFYLHIFSQCMYVISLSNEYI